MIWCIQIAYRKYRTRRTRSRIPHLIETGGKLIVMGTSSNINPLLLEAEHEHETSALCSPSPDIGRVSIISDCRKKQAIFTQSKKILNAQLVETTIFLDLIFRRDHFSSIYNKIRGQYRIRLSKYIKIISEGHTSRQSAFALLGKRSLTEESDFGDVENTPKHQHQASEGKLNLNKEFDQIQSSTSLIISIPLETVHEDQNECIKNENSDSAIKEQTREQQDKSE